MSTWAFGARFTPCLGGSKYTHSLSSSEFERGHHVAVTRDNHDDVDKPA
jgi:hypothetical protein